MGLKEQMWTWDQMENFFYMTNQEKADVVWECRISDLAHPEMLQKLLDIYGNGIKATTKDVTVMYLAGWFGYLCGAMHFLSSDGWKVTPENIKLQLYKNQRGGMLISFLVLCEDLIVQDNNKWVVEFYEKDMTPILKQMKGMSNNKLLQMWYQVTHSLYWITDRMKGSCLSLQSKNQYGNMMKMFMDECPSSFLGVSTKEHPYAKRLIFIDNPWNLEEPMPLKPSCCLAYQTEGGHLCYTCPRMKKSERQSKFDSVVEKHST